MLPIDSFSLHKLKNAGSPLTLPAKRPGSAGLPALLAAPVTDYGKTTLLAQWARTSHYVVAWLSIDQEGNNPERFLRLSPIT